MNWQERADRVLDTLFVKGQPEPTFEQLRDAYPFGERKMHPYKVWLERIKVWKYGHAIGLRAWYPPNDKTP